MAHYDIDVATIPLAESVDRLSHTVSQVDASVSDMTTQLVEAEKMAAEHVSTNVTYGFYMLTRNQFAQKAIALEKELSTTMLKIQTYSKKLEEVKARMEKDYNSISAQYLKIFKNIDAAMRKSVSDLDKGLVDVTVGSKEKMSERRLEGSMKAVAYPESLLPIAQSLPLAKIKKGSKELLDDIAGYIKSGREFSRKIDSSLSAQTVGAEGETVYFPVVLFESENTVIPDTYVIEVKMPAFPSTLSGLDGSVSSKTVDLKGNDELWEKSPDEIRNLLLGKLGNLCAGLDSRKAELILSLARASEWEELGD